MSPELVSVRNTESEHVSCIVYTQCNRDQDLVRFFKCKIVRYCCGNNDKNCGNGAAKIQRFNNIYMYSAVFSLCDMI